MIHVKDQVFTLETKHSSYGFHVLETGHLEHLYYGKKIHFSKDALAEKHAFGEGNVICYDEAHPALSLENYRLEMSSYGKGDIREPMIQLIHQDGGRTSDFLFDSYEITRGKEAFQTLPGSYGGEEEVEHLAVYLKDANYQLTLTLHYYVFEEEDVITRSAVLLNGSQETIQIERFLSNQLDFEDHDFCFTTFHGAWAREMQKVVLPVNGGKIVNSSFTGSSSSRANPFVMLGRPKTTEDAGDAYGFNLIYSGNHYEAVEVSAFHKMRFVSGINPEGFSYLLEPGESFEAPEAVMTYSGNGYNGMSQNLHAFINHHIVRGEWARKERPVLLNSWEAAYFDINEKKLLKLASTAAKCGMELFVMDDGWFGKRKDDRSSLGDWYVNKEKLPNGVEGLAKKIEELGLLFGIWVEPEMVNVDSDLYRAHPNWTIEIPGIPHSEGRNQRILDLVNPEVQEYLITSMSKIFSIKGISYVKWDMNRIFSDAYSRTLPRERQGEVFHRYILGLYRVMQVLTQRFPHILFEGCAAGGNRFDLGILCYFPQIWASDDTDAVYRVNAMTNYSYGYPMSTVSAHVSACPNHQTLRVTPLETRFHVASFGVCGYECNLNDMKPEELEEIKSQVALYKNWRSVMQYGHFYRGRTDYFHEWTVVSDDQDYAVGMIVQELTMPNSPFHQYFAKGLDPEKEYHFTNRFLKYNIKGFGDLINTASPIHVKNESLLQNIIAKFVKMDGETEDYQVYGDLLMEAGIKLHQAFAGTGYNEEVRYFPDFASRLYFMKNTEEEKEEKNSDKLA